MTEAAEAPAVATEAAAEAPAVTEAPAGAETTETAPEPPAEPAPAGKRDWRETRIDQLTREKHEARREADRLRALVEAKAAEDKTGLVPETEVEKRAAQLAEQREYIAKVTAWAEKGNKEYRDFNERCATVAGLGLSPAERPEFMATIADMDDGHKIVAHLANHPETAMALSKHPAHKMALELAKLSETLRPKPAPISKAPPPVSAPTGAVKPERDVYDANLSAAEYYKLRAEQRAARGRR